MANPAEERAAILQTAIARGKQLRPEHQAEYDRYVDMGIVKAPGRSLPESAAKRYEEDLGVYGALKRAKEGFQPDYAGNIAGDVENWAQALFDVGTPGQRDWWADFRSADNLIRNQLFGSALTAHEKAAYNATTINPRMSPKEVQKNLERRYGIVKDAMKRRTDFLKKNKYDPAAVDALAGEYGADFSDQPKGKWDGWALEPAD